MEDDQVISIPEAPAPEPKKRGWPKGKPRGPRKPREESPERAPEAPTPPEPRVEAAAPVKRRRRARRAKTGLLVGKKFYPGIKVLFEDPWFKIIAAENSETWINVGTGVVFATKGLPIAATRPYNQPSWGAVSYTSNDTGTPIGPEVGMLRPVGVAREQEVRAHNQAAKAELEGLMGSFGLGG